MSFNLEPSYRMRYIKKGALIFYILGSVALTIAAIFSIISQIYYMFTNPLQNTALLRLFNNLSVYGACANLVLVTVTYLIVFFSFKRLNMKLSPKYDLFLLLIIIMFILGIFNIFRIRILMMIMDIHLLSSANAFMNQLMIYINLGVLFFVGYYILRFIRNHDFPVKELFIAFLILNLLSLLINVSMNGFRYVNTTLYEKIYIGRLICSFVVVLASQIVMIIILYKMYHTFKEPVR